VRIIYAGRGPSSDAIEFVTDIDTTGNPFVTVNRTSLKTIAAPSLALKRKLYWPGIGKETLVVADEVSPMEASAGPVNCNHELCREAGGFGFPSSETEP
jgi:hypothetical protein